MTKGGSLLNQSSHDSLTEQHVSGQGPLVIGDDEDEPSLPPEGPPPADKDIYAKLSHPFEHTFQDPNGFTHITGEQVATRLNQVLGLGGWSFRIIERWTEEGFLVSHGQIEATIDGVQVVREQYGGQRIALRRDNGQPVDLAKNWKGSGTDCLKKCGSLLGIGLYLMAKNPAMSQQARPAQRTSSAPAKPPPARPPAQTAAQAPVKPPATSAKAPITPFRQRPADTKPTNDIVSDVPALLGTSFTCEECSLDLQPIELSGDRGTWSPAQLAAYGKHHFGRILCANDYRKTAEARRKNQVRATQQAALKVPPPEAAG
jgi:hypothetical protein